MKETQLKKFSIVMEGGGMRGLYTAGVIDVLMENEIYADSAVGVSAGAVFGCNYKSRQIGRVLRYNKKYCKDLQWCVRTWIQENRCIMNVPTEMWRILNGCVRLHRSR